LVARISKSAVFGGGKTLMARFSESAVFSDGKTLMARFSETSIFRDRKTQIARNSGNLTGGLERREPSDMEVSRFSQAEIALFLPVFRAREQ
jgi:hypothetical protein